MKASVTGLLKGRITRRRLLAAVLPTAGVSLALAREKDDEHHQSFKLEGAWIARVPDTPLQWNYVMSPCDPSGRRAALTGFLEVAIPAAVLAPPGVVIPDFDYNSLSTGEMVMIGRDTTRFTVVGYSIKKVVPSTTYPFFEQVALIWVTSGEGKFTAPDKLRVTHHLAFYLPSADTDNDGLPEGDPFFCLPPTISLDTRVGLMPPCTP